MQKKAVEATEGDLTATDPHSLPQWKCLQDLPKPHNQCRGQHKSKNWECCPVQPIEDHATLASPEMAPGDHKDRVNLSQPCKQKQKLLQ